jgi:hypothetical protein
MVAQNNPIKCEFSSEIFEDLKSICSELSSLYFQLLGTSVFVKGSNSMEFNTLVSDLEDFIDTYNNPLLPFDIGILHSFAKSTYLFAKHFVTSPEPFDINCVQTLRIIALRFEILYYSLMFDFVSEFDNLLDKS